MSLKTFLFADFRWIINKIHIGNILMQITSIFYIKSVGVVFFIVLCISFGKFTFSNTSNSIKKHMAFFLKDCVQFVQFFFSPKKMTTRFWNFTVHNVVQNDR